MKVNKFGKSSQIYTLCVKNIKDWLLEVSKIDKNLTNKELIKRTWYEFHKDSKEKPYKHIV